MISAMIFDLDGTLADTLHDIGAAMNHALAASGLPAHPIEAYRRFVGEGVERLAERAMPPDRAADRPRVLAAYRARYAEHLLDTSAPYPGVPELLDALSARGVPMAILSNKPDPATQQIVAALFARWRFAAVSGDRAGRPRKPDPTAALELAAALGRAPADCALVGDTAIDLQTARAAGMRAIGVLWGLTGRAGLAGADDLVARPDELLRFLSPA
jgi:phosphoglycolate phosphatase